MTILWKPDLAKGIPGDFNGLEIDPDVDRASRISVVDAPTVVGGRAIRFTVRPGDVVNNGNRCELKRNLPQTEFERVTAFSVFFPAGFPTLAKAWQLFAQWHQSYKQNPTTGEWETRGQSPPVSLNLNGDEMRLTIHGPDAPYPSRVLWRAPMILDRWLRFVLNARWAENGWLQLFLDGKEVLPKTLAQTTFPPFGNYLKLGLYRNSNERPGHPVIRADATLYHANIVEADRLEDILSPATSQPPPPPDVPSGPVPVWRVGDVLNGRALMKGDLVVGFVNNSEIATQIVAAMNAAEDTKGQLQ